MTDFFKENKKKSNNNMGIIKTEKQSETGREREGGKIQYGNSVGKCDLSKTIKTLLFVLLSIR